MPSLLTTTESARYLSTALPPSFRKTFSPDTIRTYVDTGLLPDSGGSIWTRISVDDLDAFISQYPATRLPRPYLRVSLGEQEASAVAEPTSGQLWRTHRGYDHLNRAHLSRGQIAHAISGLWPLSPQTADRVINEQIPLVGSVKGVVTQRTVYFPTGWFRAFGAIAFDVDQARFDNAWGFTGDGALIEVTPGPIAHLVDR